MVKGFRLINDRLQLLQATLEDIPNNIKAQTFAITSIMVCNNDSSGTASFDMHFIANGDPFSDGSVPGPTNSRVINNLTLAPEETFTFDTEKIILHPGDSIEMYARHSDGIYEQWTDGEGNILQLTRLGAVISYLEV